ncbi:hypothetical protein ACLOJK_030651 [Asimina triloba]
MLMPMECTSSTLKTALALSPFVLLALVCLFYPTPANQLNDLSRTWRSVASFNPQSPSPPKPAFRLLIGILTRADLYERRNLLRLVYGLQSPQKAQVDVKFVFCSLAKEDQTVLVPLEIMLHDDVITLNCTENMNDGKTYTYLSSLPSILDNKDGEDRPYDYVMKADDDIYFRLDQLVETLIDLPREDLYHGFVIPCKEMDPRGRYMAGMGYTLSWDLVEWIASTDVAKNRTSGTEDLLVGQWLNEGRRGKNRYNVKPAMYNYPLDSDPCSHEMAPDTVAVHRLKDQTKWVRTLQYFNVTQGLNPSKLYHIPNI